MRGSLAAEALLGRFISTSTVSSESNLALADIICDVVDAPDVHVWRGVSADRRKVNLVIQKGPPAATDREGLVLCGHMDTVPALEPDWQSDPFALKETDDRFIGRGTTDMKGFLALATHAFVRARSAQLKRPLTLVFTRDEEVGMQGARELVEQWGVPFEVPKPMIIGEPTSLRAVYTHKGHVDMRITLRGRSAHSAYPHLGDNAIEKAGRAIVALTELAEQLRNERSAKSASFADVPFVPLNVAMVTGGVAVNVVPERCEIRVGMRPLPSATIEACAERVASALDRVLPKAYELEVVHGSPGFELSQHTSIYHHLCTADRITGGVSFATDASWLSQGGFECVICGPGSIEVAHRPNEFLLKSQWVEAEQLIEQAISHFCL